MNLKWTVFGFSVGGYGNKFEIEINENELEDMTEEQKDDFIYQQCWNYALENLQLTL